MVQMEQFLLEGEPDKHIMLPLEAAADAAVVEIKIPMLLLIKVVAEEPLIPVPMVPMVQMVECL
jgi:hypothetical protein